MGEGPCEAARPAEGQVIVDSVDCSARLLGDGEGRTSDFYLANAWYRAVVRHPQASLTAPGVGGGTVIDAAPWGFSDRLHEAIPVVGGGWLDVEAMVLEEDRIRIGGTVRSLPHVEANALGAWREVSWIVDPDGPWLRLEGAEGLYVHPSSRQELLSEQLVDEIVYGHDGRIGSDLGGAVQLEGTTGLLVASSHDAWSWLATETQPLNGVAEGADRLSLYRADEVVGSVRVDNEGLFDTEIDAAIDGVRAEAQGRQPSSVVPPSDALGLSVGAAGAIEVSVGWTGARPRPVRVAWTDAAGRGGVSLLEPTGGRLDLGAGYYTLKLTAGPAVASRVLQVEVPPEGEVDVGASLLPYYDAGSRALAAVRWPGSRSRSWRGTDVEALTRAVGAGFDFAVVTPEDDVAGAGAVTSLRGHLRHRNGALLLSPAGWSVSAWPWSSDRSLAGHGVPAIRALAATQVLSLAGEVVGTSRFTVVDLAWLDEVGSPLAEAIEPDMVMLSAPGEQGPTSGAWQRWYDWLDGGADLVPVGPATWVDVLDLDILGAEDIERGLVRGNSCATTGGLVTLSVDGVGPGELVPLAAEGPFGERVSLPVVVAANSGARTLNRLALVGPGGTLLASWDVTREDATRTLSLSPHVRWVIAVAWSADGEDWAATGPVWLDAP